MPELTQQQQNAYENLRLLFQSYGLPSANDILAVIREGVENNDSEDTVTLRLQETATWKQRFAGNEIRKQKGLNVLSVGEYLSTENTYGQILRNAGLPGGFYDDKSDYANLIGGNVSASELQDRVNIAGDIINREDPNVLAQLAQRGINKGLLLAHALDPERAAPIIKRQHNSILIGAAGARAGVGVSTATADGLAERGVGESQAIQGFGQINDFLDSTSKAAAVHGEEYGVDEAVSEVFDGGDGTKRKRLLDSERADFGGRSNYGVNRQSVAGSY